MSEFRLYKPNKEGTGSASKLSFRENVVTVKKEDETVSRYTEILCFWVAAQQNGKDEDDNARFWWEQKDGRQVTMKLGDADVGELLAVLNGKKPNVGGDMGIYHKNENGNSSLQFKANIQNGNFIGYYVRLASQDKNKKVTEVKHTVTLGEAEILRLFLERYVQKKYW